MSRGEEEEDEDEQSPGVTLQCLLCVKGDEERSPLPQGSALP